MDSVGTGKMVVMEVEVMGGGGGDGGGKEELGLEALKRSRWWL